MNTKKNNHCEHRSNRVCVFVFVCSTPIRRTDVDELCAEEKPTRHAAMAEKPLWRDDWGAIVVRRRKYISYGMCSMCAYEYVAFFLAAYIQLGAFFSLPSALCFTIWHYPHSSVLVSVCVHSFTV